ncbi:efflux RND transporter permease subunit [Marinilabiliaceae bacterium ANBcel2]|nr:efflux RND transporter permease subunit [Marinilabiliaceae bacterium ANBcel2]
MLDKILTQRALLNAFLAILVIGGVWSFANLSKLEDPEIPVKAAVVVTSYPGASAEEVDKEVTDVLEEAIQELQDIDNIESVSMPGISQITIDIEGYVTKNELPQKWDHLRRKVNDATSSLPPGANTPVVNDDFGDVYGIFMALSSDGYSYSELDNYAEFLKQELLQVKGVKRINIIGQKTETVDIIFSPEQFASLGINPMAIVQTINDQGDVADAGSVVSGSKRIRLAPGNKFQSVEEIENLNIQGVAGNNFRLGDIATIERSFLTPAHTGFSYNNRESLGLAISMQTGDNIIKLGERIDKELADLILDIPVGIEVHTVFDQASQVQSAIREFTVNLATSVLIVIVVLLLSMGFRAGLLISSSLVFTILGTFIFMGFFNMTLDKVSLAAIVIAMGMLVDNAIVVADGILADLSKGVSRKEAFVKAAKQNSFPLIGATFIAILAFMPLAFNTTSAGEFLKPLFYVLTISLSLSWLLAMVQVPFMASLFYKNGYKNGNNKKSDTTKQSNNVNSGALYRYFGGIIRFALLHKTMFTLSTLIILLLSFLAYDWVNKDFFPQEEYDQFMLEYRLPQGADIYQVENDLYEMTNELLQWDEIDFVASSIGRSPVRYTLSRPMNSYNPRYGELIIGLKDAGDIFDVIEQAETYFSDKYIDADIRCRQYSPIGGDYKIQAMFTGPDSDVLNSLALEAKQIMHQEPGAIFVNDDWGNRTKVLAPVYSPVKGQRLNITRSAMANSLAMSSNGMPVGLYFEDNNRIPIVMKIDTNISDKPDQIESIPVWGRQSRNSVPLGQIVDEVTIESESYVINRYDGQRAIKVQCDPARDLTAPEVMDRIRADIENISMPRGYKMEWHGEYKSSNRANQALLENLPLALLLMVIIVIALFNNFKQPVIIFLIFPLAFIGIIAGFLLTRLNFGYLAITGGLGLIGMMIKNTVVLLDQVNIEIKSGKVPLIGLIRAAISRVRPVSMAALTTILGMFPLVFDDIFQSMAIAIMFGLLVGTLITLLVVPVLYALFYKVDTKKLRLIGKSKK